jgi:hypothetical protein
MNHPIVRCSLGLSFILVLLTHCDLAAVKRGSEPVIESAVLTDSNYESNKDNIYYGGEPPHIVLNLSDEDENIDKIILNVYCGDELKYKSVEDVIQWKNPEEYRIPLKRLDCDPGDWKIVVTVKDERGLTAETTFNMIVVDLCEYLTIEAPVRSKMNITDKSDDSVFLNKVYIDFTFENPHSCHIDEIRFTFYLLTTDGQKYSHNVFLSTLDGEQREYFYVKSTQTVDRVYIDADSLVLKVY